MPPLADPDGELIDVGEIIATNFEQFLPTRLKVGDIVMPRSKFLSLIASRMMACMNDCI